MRHPPYSVSAPPFGSPGTRDEVRPDHTCPQALMEWERERSAWSRTGPADPPQSGRRSRSLSRTPARAMLRQGIRAGTAGGGSGLSGVRLWVGNGHSSRHPIYQNLQAGRLIAGRSVGGATRLRPPFGTGGSGTNLTVAASVSGIFDVSPSKPNNGRKSSHHVAATCSAMR